MRFHFYEIYLGTSWGLNIDEDQLNKTQRQLCKRLAGPFISFPGLVWSEKEFYFGYDH